MSAAQLRTVRSLIRGVAECWRAHYQRRQIAGGECTWFDAEKRAIHEALLELDPETATAKDVRSIIGNGSWTACPCDGCGQDFGVVVRVGQTSDHESATAALCRSCLKEALALLPPDVELMIEADGRWLARVTASGVAAYGATRSEAEANAIDLARKVGKSDAEPQGAAKEG